MLEDNGRSPEQAILYARVSTEEQVKSGYSLRQQVERLREYADTEGYNVAEEIEDPGQSGATLERPGMDRVRDLVAAGGVSAVLAQDRDRFAREPAYLYLLREEFAEHGTKLQALNDRGDESPEGQLTDGILDQLAKFERAKTAERTRRGKNRKAKEGKIVAVSRPVFGFKLNAARDGYEVDDETMPIVRRIFREISVEGKSTNSVRTALIREGVETPSGRVWWNKNEGHRWNMKTLADMIRQDAYLARPFEEVRELVPAEVASRLDPGKHYGISWWGKKRVITRQVAYTKADGGRGYRRRQKVIHKPPEEWIGVPVPDSGIPPEWVYAARRILEERSTPSAAGNRFWELTGSVLVCGGCGWSMVADRRRKNAGGDYFLYYRCNKKKNHGSDACEMPRSWRAEETEEVVWSWVKGQLLNPERLRAGLERFLEEERSAARGDPELLLEACLRKISELDDQRLRAQNLAIEGLLSTAELRERLAGLDDQRRTLEREATALRNQREALTNLELEAEALLERYASMVPEGLEHFTAEDRHEAYQALRLKVTAGVDGSIEATGVLSGLLSEDLLCHTESTYRSTRKPG